jgi:succinyl-CoA synthetase beta subunit
MNLHEYQGKELLSTFGVRIQRGIVASTVEEAVEAAEKLLAQVGG